VVPELTSNCILSMLWLAESNPKIYWLLATMLLGRENLILYYNYAGNPVESSDGKLKLKVC
jgi:hypothetical protein